MSNNKFLIPKFCVVAVVIFISLSSTVSAQAINNEDDYKTLIESISSQVSLLQDIINALYTLQNYSQIASEPSVHIATAAATSIPPAPTNLTARGISQFDIQLTWNVNSDSSYESGVRIERATSPSGPFSVIMDIPRISYPTETLTAFDGTFISGLLDPAVTYYYRVYEYNTIGNSAYSNVASASVLSDTPPSPNAPLAPSNLIIKRISSSEVDLAWTDNSTNEDGFIVEKSIVSATSGFSPIKLLDLNQTNLPIRELIPNTTYYFRVKSFTYLNGKSAPTSPLTAITPAPALIADANNTWLFVITNRGTALPAGGVDFLCNSVSTGLIQTEHAWVKAEANKNLIAKPFNNIACISQQITIPSSLYPGPIATVESQTLQLPLNQAGVMSFLENDASVPSTVRSAIVAAKYVSVFHYIPSQIPFVDNAVGAKYSFLYFYPYPAAPASSATEFYPAFTVDQYGETLSHELMHNLGATDKYYVGFEQACLINPATGQEYNGYDIMCHRVGVPGSGFFKPPYEELIVSDSTAKEIKWTAHPADVNGDYQLSISEITNYSSCWKTGCTWPNRENPVPIAYVTNGGSLWRTGETYHFVESATCPSCWVTGL